MKNNFKIGIFLFIIAIFLALLIQLKNVEEPYKFWLFLLSFLIVIVGVVMTERKNKD